MTLARSTHTHTFHCLTQPPAPPWAAVATPNCSPIRSMHDVSFVSFSASFHGTARSSSSSAALTFAVGVVALGGVAQALRRRVRGLWGLWRPGDWGEDGGGPGRPSIRSGGVPEGG